ncbi:MAG: hypothetical protein ACFB9M_14525 [Myxococcota bacterium]
MVNWIYASILGYLGLGAVVGTAFVFRGAAVVASGARGAGWGFRVLIWPGSVGLWPFVLIRWLTAERSP